MDDYLKELAKLLKELPRSDPNEERKRRVPQVRDEKAAKLLEGFIDESKSTDQNVVRELQEIFSTQFVGDTSLNSLLSEVPDTFHTKLNTDYGKLDSGNETGFVMELASFGYMNRLLGYKGKYFQGNQNEVFNILQSDAVFFETTPTSFGFYMVDTYENRYITEVDLLFAYKGALIMCESKVKQNQKNTSFSGIVEKYLEIDDCLQIIIKGTPIRSPNTNNKHYIHSIGVNDDIEELVQSGKPIFPIEYTPRETE